MEKQRGRWWLWLFCLALTCLGGGCRRHDIRVATLSVPGLQGSGCAQVIQEACIRYPGIKAVRPDYERRELQVTYNSMEIALKNIEYLIVMAGFDVNDLQARPEAAAQLPPECR